MNNLNSSNVFFLTMISFLGCIAIFALSFYYPHSIFYIRNKKTQFYDKNFSDYIKSSFHSTNNTLNISVMENSIYTDIKGFHALSFLNKYENETEVQKEEKKLSNLSLFNSNYFNIAIIANFFSFYLCFFLFISFFIEINECETFCGCFLFYLCANVVDVVVVMNVVMNVMMIVVNMNVVMKKIVVGIVMAVIWILKVY